MLSHWRTSSSRLHFLAACLLTVSPALSWAASCGKTHTVASGEGCWSIFTDAKLTQAQFLAMNAGLDCALLQVGQQVCTAVACSKFYTVQSGDYCYKIQTEQKVSDADMKTLNPGFTCEELFPGQNVCVSAPTTTVPTTTSAPATTAVPTTSIPVTTPTAVPVPSPTGIVCQRSLPVSQGDTCYNLATANGKQLSQFVALNPGLNCSILQAGDEACIEGLCERIYKVQEGDWCAKIESAYNLASGGLVKLNPGLSCEALARGQDVCVEPGVPGNSADNVVVPPIDRFPALAAGTTIPQSPILAFASAEGNARDTFYGEVIFQSDSQHLEAFAHNDLNGDGLLDQDELQKMMSFDPAALRGITEINSKLNADNLVPEMLKAADLNGDGKINKDEYLFAIRQIQNVTNVVTDLAADNTPAGLERKRIIPAMIAAVAVIIGLVVADVTLFFQILAKNELFRGNDLLSYLDVRYWDGKGNPPSCAAYMYWSSNCGAIGSGHAKSCSNGGERVFGSSCVTHFHKGSAGCGFLGCKSLCYNYNLDNCDCSALKYTIERDTEYTDSPWSTTNEVGVAACRSKCGGTTGCVGYSVSPGSSDTTLSCKVFKTMSNKKSNGKYTSFRLEGSPVGGQQCAPVEAGYTVWPTSVMEEDQKKGEMFSEAYRTTTSSLAKRAAPARVDRRDDAKFSTTIKRQTCGLCAPFSFTSTVEGSLKIKKGGYTDNDDLSPVWVGMCKGEQECGGGGRHDRLRDKVGRSYIKREVCVPSTQTSNPKCDAACTGFLPYVSTYKKFDFVGLVDRGEIRKKVEDVKLWISETGPVMASMCTNTTAWQNYATSLKNTGPDTVFYDKDKQWGNSTCGKCDHAITIVGYFEFQRASKTSLAWIIHNSYGTTYGKRGYQFIEEGSAGMRKMDWWGVKVDEGRVHDEF
ncbi:hypothetical protein RSOLAG1IB_10620 [Rhizoctonia solani AG-1 IB]|uniref:Uncharacterized protein n=1 Tax=Thanatephorus cucumeris (strain AG1-IB / isolate 7/3/14) TaxID=1108050 RepID=A0A0B7G391_THACB|nr:hypothetical protein RSOLAG1IB_10620 [Rhizoctonia solani AG-1 IB]